TGIRRSGSGLRLAFVREADRTKIAQRFIAGLGNTNELSPRSGRLKYRRHLFSRPLHGLGMIRPPSPSAEALGYFQTSASQTKIYENRWEQDFFRKHLHGKVNTNIPNRFDDFSRSARLLA